MNRLLAAALTAAVALAGTGLPPPADAGALSSAVRSAIARRAAASPATAFGKAAYGKPHDIIVQRARHPQAAAHIEHAQKNGQPSVLHIDRAGAAERRAAATGAVNPSRRPSARYERDEYPPAFAREGGTNSNVRWISPQDNRGAGASVGAQARHLPDGAKIRILVQ